MMSAFAKANNSMTAAARAAAGSCANFAAMYIVGILGVIFMTSIFVALPICVLVISLVLVRTILVLPSQKTCHQMLQA